ncbi:MAG: transglutaminase family protein [Caldilineaceae bacterium]
MPQFQITHTTAYHYEEPISLCYNEARLLPRSFVSPLFQQECVTAALAIEPTWNDQRERVDFFGNRVTYFTIRQPHAQMVLTATSAVVVRPTFAAAIATDAIIAQLSAHVGRLSCEEAGTRLHTPGNGAAADETEIDARQYVLPSTYGRPCPALVAYAERSFSLKRPLLEATADLMARIYDDFDFVAGATTIATPLTEVLAARKGVCQDFAHLMIACLRSQGLAARYMSGYIETLPPPGAEKLAGSDASHAWCALYVPGLGWIDFDPTNNLIPQEQHVVLGWGRDFADVTPLKGVFFGSGQHTLDVAVDMARMG